MDKMRKFEELLLKHEKQENSQCADEPSKMEPRLEDEEEFIDIMELIPKIDARNILTVDEFKKKMIQLILELEVDTTDGFKMLIDASIEKNPDIDPEMITEMFMEIEEFIQHFKDGVFDSSEDEQRKSA